MAARARAHAHLGLVGYPNRLIDSVLSYDAPPKIGFKGDLGFLGVRPDAALRNAHTPPGAEGS